MTTHACVAPAVVQVLLEPLPGLLGCVVEVQVTGATRWSVSGKLLQVGLQDILWGLTGVLLSPA